MTQSGLQVYSVCEGYTLSSTLWLQNRNNKIPDANKPDVSFPHGMKKDSKP